MNCVYSTLTADQLYTVWGKAAPGGSATPTHQILIKGGSNVADKRLITRIGVMTQVSDKDLEALEQVELFQIHQKNGFITVQKRKVDPEVVAADQQSRDKSAPLTPQDIAAEAEQAESVGASVAMPAKRK